MTTIQDGASANRLILRINPLNEIGETEPDDRSRIQVVVDGIVGSPEGRALGSPGDIRVRQDLPQIWQKLSGYRTRTGWGLVGSGSSSLPAHAATHEAGGTDEINVAGLSGLLADPQTPLAHAATHSDGGSDEITVEDLATASVTTTDVLHPDGLGGLTMGAIALPGGLAENNVLRLLPASVGVAPVNSGIPNTTQGAASYPVLAATNLLTSTPRTRWTSPVGAGSSGSHRSNVLMWWRGNAAGLGGFEIVFRFALSAFAAGHRSFVGLRGATAQIPTVDPSTLTDIIGMGFNLGASQWNIMHNDAAGAATVIPLGASFNVSTAELLELRLLAAPNAATVDWRARNLSTAAEQSGTIAADLPAATQFLSSNAWVNTGSDATISAQIDVPFIYALS